MLKNRFIFSSPNLFNQSGEIPSNQCPHYFFKLFFWNFPQPMPQLWKIYYPWFLRHLFLQKTWQEQLLQIAFRLLHYPLEGVANGNYHQKITIFCSFFGHFFQLGVKQLSRIPVRILDRFKVFSFLDRSVEGLFEGVVEFWNLFYVFFANIMQSLNFKINDFYFILELLTHFLELYGLEEWLPLQISLFLQEFWLQVRNELLQQNEITA